MIQRIDERQKFYFLRPSPTPEDRSTPEFNAIWSAIKYWDIERRPGEGYARADGSDVLEIMRALRTISQDTTPRSSQ